MNENLPAQLDLLYRSVFNYYEHSMPNYVKHVITFFQSNKLTHLNSFHSSVNH